MKRIFVSLLALTIPLISMAQAQKHGFGGGSSGRVYGKVVDDNTHKGVGFATVAVLNPKDSSVESGALTEENGDFEIKNLKMGEHILKVKYVGFSPLYKKFSITPGSSNLDLGNFGLKASTAKLNTVDVTGQKSAFSMKLDKKVFDVSKSLTSTGGTAEDVLKEVPSVDVDIDGNVTVRNSAPKIFVNGKSTTLTLEQIPAETIEKVEVITNPSSKYSAEGISGILNIVLKKNRKPGMNGRLMAGGDTRGGYNLGGNLNVYKNPFNVSVSYFNHYRSDPNSGTMHRENYQKGNTDQLGSVLDQNSDGKRYGNFQMGRIGLDYFMDNRNTFSVEGGFGGGEFNHKGSIHSLFHYPNSAEPDSVNDKYSKDGHHFNFLFGDFDYKHTFRKEGHELTGNVHLSKSDNGGDGYTHYEDENGHVVEGDINQVDYTDGDGVRFSAQTDYVNPLTESMKLEAGLKYSDRNSNSVHNLYKGIAPDTTFDAQRSSDYKYDEKTFAAYVQFSQSFDKFDYQAGLRAEQYTYSGSIPSEDEHFKPSNGDLGLFPSLYLTYRATESDQFQLNYTRRIHRPRFWQRIPYTDYSDPQNLRTGNPNLKPEYTNSFEVSYNKLFGQSNFMATLYYRNTNNSIQRYSQPYKGSSDTLITKSINADTNNSFGAEFTLQTQITKWWNVTANLNLFQDQLSTTLGSDLNNREVNQSNFSWFGKINSEAMLPANFTLQLTGRYSGPRTTTQGKRYRYGGVDFGVKKSFLKKKNLTATLTLSDVFNTHKNKSIYEEPGFFNQTRIRYPKSRRLKLTVTYSFGKQNLQLFRRKSNKSNQGGGEMQQMGGQGGGL